MTPVANAAAPKSGAPTPAGSPTQSAASQAGAASGPAPAPVPADVVAKALTQSVFHVLVPIGPAAKNPAMRLTTISTGDATKSSLTPPDGGPAVRFSSHTSNTYAPSSMAAGVESFSSAYHYTADCSTLALSSQGVIAYGRGAGGPVTGTGLTLTGPAPVEVTKATWSVDPNRKDSAQETLVIGAAFHRPNHFTLCHLTAGLTGGPDGATVCTEHDRTTGEMVAASRQAVGTDGTSVEEWRWNADSHVQMMDCNDSHPVHRTGSTGS